MRAKVTSVTDPNLVKIIKVIKSMKTDVYVMKRNERQHDEIVWSAAQPQQTY